MKIFIDPKARRAAHPSAGFSLMELLIVVAVIGIIAAIAVMALGPAKRGTQEKLAVAKLHEVSEVQSQFRVTLGRRRYGTLAELRAAQSGSGPLLNPTTAPVDAGGSPVAVGGWIIREPSGAPSGAALQSAYAVEAVPATGNPSTSTYCARQDGVVRKGDTTAGCTINSPSVDQ